MTVPVQRILLFRPLPELQCPVPKDEKCPVPKDVDALMFLSKCVRVELVSVLKSPNPSTDMSFIRFLISCGRVVLLSQ